jgi:aminoglycoside phosphotransferase family enzyme/predicted kinase
MDVPSLITGLSDPRAYPFQAATIEVRQTHISVVFLTELFVYKVKKPVDLGFLDFSTLSKRRHYCQEEVRLNRRLAPGVYLDVVGVTRQGDRLLLEGSGEPLEWAVKMRRLPDEALLERHLQQNPLAATLASELGGRVAQFHVTADRGRHIARYGSFDIVARNARENLEQANRHVGSTISRRVWEQLTAQVEQALVEHRALIDERAARGVPCDTHGDLRPDHVYLFPDRGPPDDIVVIDCIEFNERFRFADPVADVAFLISELRFQGYERFASALTEAYFVASRDDQGRCLLPWYVSYRAAVRGKVESIKSGEPEVPAAQREMARQRACAYWLLALGALGQPVARPALILVGGLPGSGKSTLSADLSETADFQVIRSDVVRKELAGLESRRADPRAFGQGIYSHQWNERTYGECLRRAEAAIFDGRRVIVDASFREDAPRQRFLELARRWGVPALTVVCRADAEQIRARLAARRDDASDADWNVYQQAARLWQSPSAMVQPYWHEVNTGRSRADSLAQVLDMLREAGVF